MQVQRFIDIQTDGEVANWSVGPGGRHLAWAIKYQPIVHVYEVGAQVERRFGTPEAGAVTCLAFSPNAEVLAVGRASGEVEVWNILAGEMSHRWSLSNGSWDSVRFVRGGRWLLAVRQRSLHVFDLVEGAEIPMKCPKSRWFGETAEGRIAYLSVQDEPVTDGPTHSFHTTIQLKDAFLLQAAREDDYKLQDVVVNQLASIGERGVTELIKASTDPNWQDRLTASRALGAIGTKECLSALLALLNDELERVRIEAAIALVDANQRFAGKELMTRPMPPDTCGVRYRFEFHRLG